GTYAIEQGTLALNSNYSLGYVGADFTITHANLTITAHDKTSQYSDPLQDFTYSITGFVNEESLINSGVSGLPSFSTSPVLSDPVAQIPGIYSIIPSTGSLSSNNYRFTFVNGTYTVKQEDADFTFDMQNPVSVKVESDGGNNAAFVWKVTITQDNDGKLGDLSKIEFSDITLTFISVGVGGEKSVIATRFDPITGIAEFDVPANLLIVETYVARVSLDNDWYTANPVEEVLVIYDPSLGFTTGGGWFYWPAGTSNPQLEGAKTNFGFTMKYNRKGTGVQGSFLLITHLPDGSIVRIKSNAIYGLAIIQKTYPGIASFSGKCVYTRVDKYGNVLAEAGNQDFTVYVKDMNEPGEDTDMFWFNTKLTIASEIPFSLDSNNNNKLDDAEYVMLGGGNIVVPHTAGSSSDPVEEEPPKVPNKKK
ncbi:MAG TPA: hypothetical protein DCG34_08145, partial [Clostridiales bacterium]|nr:hypothetical protein [Clostridiales bacterium]